MRQFWTKELITQLAKYFNSKFEQYFCRVTFKSKEVRLVYKRYVYNQSMLFCVKHRSKFDPRKGQALTYFATIILSFLIHKYTKVKKGFYEEISQIEQSIRDRKLNLILQ